MISPELEDLIEELRKHADTDVAFAQRVALVCCHLIAEKLDGTAAIRTVFRIQ